MSIKQVILVRNDINMGPGKIASQVAHASMKVFFNKAVTKCFDKLKSDDCLNQLHMMTVVLNEDEASWVNGIFTKIVLEVNSETQLLDAYDAAVLAGLPCSLIQDNGLTVFGGVPTLTTVAIGPAKSEQIDLITKRFRLMK